MQDVSQRLGALHVGGQAAFERIPFEIFEEIFSYIPRSDRLAASLCSRKFSENNQKFTWSSIHVEIGDSSAITDRTERSMYLFENLPSLYRTLLKYRHLGKYTVRLSLKISRNLTYEMKNEMRCLQHFSSLQELSLSPPPYDFELPVAPSSLILDFYYDRRSFWTQCYDEPPLLKLGQYFRMPKLRKLQVEHISFEPQLHVDPFPVQQRSSPIEDLRLFDCSPQTVGILAKMLISIKCLKRLSLEMNIPWPVAEAFVDNGRHADYNRPGGQDYELAINHHAQSLEDLTIAFSDGSSTFIRPFRAVHPFNRMHEGDFSVYSQPLRPPFCNLDKFANLRRLAIPEPLLVENGVMFPSFQKLLPKLLEELQLQYPVGTKGQATGHWGEEVRIIRLRALAKDKEACLPKLKLVICWYQYHGSSSSPDLDNYLVYESDEIWIGLDIAFSAVNVHLDRVSGPFFGDTPFGQPLGISHSRLRPPELVKQGHFAQDPTRPGLYYDETTHSVF